MGKVIFNMTMSLDGFVAGKTTARTIPWGMVVKPYSIGTTVATRTMRSPVWV